ncbi:MAG: methyltransferase domain-containing protein [Candidatus Peribacteraceae bacterium]|nr:methyltransferase domain-containing protein [Candidatus Peribacteraceae bacterium]
MRKTWTMKEVAAHWDSVPEYDDINKGIDSYFRRFTDSAPLFSIPKDAKVLDIDCRTAKGTCFFKERYTTAQFTCGAMSPTFRTRALAQLEKSGCAANVFVFEGLPLPFENGHFDAVLTYETLEHTPWPDRFIAELSRVLKPGGLLVLTTPNVLWEPVHWFSATFHLDHGEGPHRMVPRGEIYRAFAQANLRVEQERSFVLIPVGPKWLLKFGKWMERILPERALRILCLRRTFICRKYELVRANTPE